MPKKTRVRTVMTVNVLKGPKSFLNMHASIFDIFFDDFERKSVRKILS